ncbi:MAG: hypothetical protein ABSH22_08135 [Tepidisphaeraceae bacterium]|jgi:hypothetical protein
MFSAIFFMAAGVGIYKMATRVKQNPGPVIDLGRAIKNLLHK